MLRKGESDDDGDSNCDWNAQNNHKGLIRDWEI